MIDWFARRDLKEAPFLIVLVVELGALSYAAAEPQHWLRAVGGMVAGFALAGFFRLVLTDAQAGLLRVRGRPFDLACYWGLAALAFGFAVLLPAR